MEKNVDFGKVIVAFSQNGKDVVGDICFDIAREKLQNEMISVKQIDDAIINKICSTHMDAAFAAGIIFGQKFDLSNTEAAPVLAELEKLIGEKGGFKLLLESCIRRVA
jgi:hypothetical protein